MAVLTQVCGGNMRGVLAGCCSAVVTTGTIASDACMTELSGLPRCCVVAGFASVSTHDVNGGFASGFHAIVAISAVTGDSGMVKG
jgi:hypothetical protein